MEEVVFSIEPALDKTVDLEVDGWEKLTVQYSVELLASTSYLCWKVKGTDQIFRILTKIVYENHGLDYKEHFSLTLKVFREDFLEWEKEEFKEPWMKRYQKMFHSLIKKT